MPLSPSAARFQELLHAAGFANEVQELAASTRTSADAAAALGCTVAQIAKSIVFRGGSGRAVLVVASGANRIDEKKVAAALGETIRKADAEFVRDRTGYVIGGVPPMGHATPPLVLLDEDIFAFERIFAAAGTPNSIFALTPDELLRMSAGRRADVKQGRTAFDPGPGATRFPGTH